MEQDKRCQECNSASVLPNSEKEYRSALKKLTQAGCSFDAQGLMTYVANCTPPLASATVKGYISAVNFARRGKKMAPITAAEMEAVRRLADGNRGDDPAWAPTKQRAALTWEMVQQIVKDVAHGDWRKETVPKPDSAIIFAYHFLYATALRKSQAAQATWGDIKLQAKDEECVVMMNKFHSVSIRRDLVDRHELELNPTTIAKEALPALRAEFHRQRNEWYAKHRVLTGFTSQKIVQANLDHCNQYLKVFQRRLGWSSDFGYVLHGLRHASARAELSRTGSADAARLRLGHDSNATQATYVASDAARAQRVKKQQQAKAMMDKLREQRAANGFTFVASDLRSFEVCREARRGREEGQEGGPARPPNPAADPNQQPQYQSIGRREDIMMERAEFSLPLALPLKFRVEVERKVMTALCEQWQRAMDDDEQQQQAPPKEMPQFPRGRIAHGAPFRFPSRLRWKDRKRIYVRAHMAAVRDHLRRMEEWRKRNTTAKKEKPKRTAKKK